MCQECENPMSLWDTGGAWYTAVLKENIIVQRVQGEEPEVIYWCHGQSVVPRDVGQHDNPTQVYLIFSQGEELLLFFL